MIHRIPGLILTDHTFAAPLDHGRPDGEQITLFAREVYAAGKEGADLPWLLFLQGGPGGKAPRPDARSGWIKRATEEYRVLLLDQRGTGRSTPLNRQSLQAHRSPEATAEHLRHFRADAIVRDAELIRKQLIGDRPWSILGQSFGGFCALTYLSLAPEGLREALITGGLPPLHRGADEVYRATYRRVLEQNRRYFARYPADQEQLQRIAGMLGGGGGGGGVDLEGLGDLPGLPPTPTLPNGEPLSVRRLQSLGMLLGSSTGFEAIHYLVEEALIDGADGPELSDTFLHGVMPLVSFATNPLYAILHEPIYCQGAGARWSAERARAEYPEFDWAPGRPFLFTGEMIYPWMFEEDRALAPLRAAAEILAHADGWPALYDAERLARNTVPVAAAVYYDDMYVETAFSEETARALGNCRVWITNEHQHNGLRADGEAILGRLIEMVRW